MGTQERLRNIVGGIETDDTGALRGSKVPEVTGVFRRPGDLAGNLGFGDVRGFLKTRTITLNSAAGADTWKLDVIDGHGDWYGVSDAFDDDEAAADVQTYLRAATGDDSLTVSEPVLQVYTVTPSENHHDDWTLVAKACAGCSVVIDNGGPVTYASSKGLPGDDHDHGTDTGVPTASSPGRGAGKEVPLGTSIVTDGTGQTAQTTLAIPTIDTVVPGDDQVVINSTEVASGGTGAVVVYAVFYTSDNTLISTTEDADGDVTITGLPSATNCYLVAWTQTANDRVSLPTVPWYFTTT